MQDFLANNWVSTLTANGLKTFDDWWQLEADWFEQPNYRRGGWSGVSRVELKSESGETRTLFLKRQENHVARTLLHPIKGIPTFVREMRIIVLLQEAQVAALTPVYFAVRKIDGKQRAVLATEALDGFSPLDQFERSSLSHAERHQLIEAVAQLIQRFHGHRFQHHSLYAKHVFVKKTEQGFEARLIDLEKTKRCYSQQKCMIRDLDSFHRHTFGWPGVDRLRFLHAYLRAAKREDDLPNIWKTLTKRTAKRLKLK